MHHSDPAMHSCIEACLACYRSCTEHAFQHCLVVGGEHVAQEHFSLMAACAEICRTAAQVMMTGSPFHQRLCRLCAEICQACADDCARLSGMESCVAACRRCAEECSRMAAAA